jgi:hypothetical protein
MKRSIIYAVAGVVFFLLAIPPHTRGACPNNPNSILNATYGWEIEDGLIAAGITPRPKVGDFFPFATTGHLTFHGDGNLSGAHDTDFGGAFFHIVDLGFYTVNPDCITGTISIPTDGLTMSIVIVGGGQEIEFTSATSGRVFSGTLQRVATAPCSASTLSGKSYGFATHGLTTMVAVGFPRIDGFVPFSNTGQISFNADGSVSGVDNVNLGGVFIPGLPIGGTFSVNPDCTGTATLTIAGNNHSWNFVILEGADHIIFVAAESGFVWSGTLTKE